MIDNTQNTSVQPVSDNTLVESPTISTGVVNGTAKDFSIMDVIASGWHLFWQRPGYFVGLTFVPFLLSLLIQFVAGLFFGLVLGNDNKEAMSLVKGLVNLLTSLVSVYLSVGIMRGFIESVQGLKPDLKEIFEPRGMVLRYVGLSILTALIVMAGYVVFIIPGIIFSLMFCLATYVFIDEKRGIVESLKRSKDLTNSVKIKLLLFFVALSVVNIIGLLCVGVGLLVTSPVTTLATIYVYETLKKQTVA